MNEALEIEGEEPNVIRAASILEDYFALVKEGAGFSARRAEQLSAGGDGGSGGDAAEPGA